MAVTSKFYSKSDKIEDGAVTAAKLADGAGVAALLTDSL